MTSGHGLEIGRKAESLSTKVESVIFISPLIELLCPIARGCMTTTYTTEKQ